MGVLRGQLAGQTAVQLCEVHQRPRQKNGVCPSCYFKQWYAKNRDGVIARTKTWKRDNRAATNRQKSRWIRKHPDIAREAQRRYLAREAGSDLVPYREVDIYERDNWTCYVCQKPIAKDGFGADMPTLDHLIPIAVGGADAPWNVAVAHMGCNSRKGRRTPDQFAFNTHTQRGDPRK